MTINPIDASVPLDLAKREPTNGSVRSRRPPPNPSATGAPVANGGENRESAGAAPRQAEQPVTQGQQAAAANMNLRFSTDKETGKTVIAIVNPTDGEVLRQMPSEEALQIAKAIGRFQGMFVNLKV